MNQSQEEGRKHTPIDGRNSLFDDELLGLEGCRNAFQIQIVFLNSLPSADGGRGE